MRSTARLAGLAVTLVLLACGEKEPKPASGTPSGAAETKKEELKYGLTPEQAKQVLAKVGDTTITLGDFADRLGGQSPYLRARYNSPERRREFLENMVRFELLALEAKKRGYEKTDEVARVGEQMMVQQMMQDLFDKHGVQLSDVSDDEIKQYYEAHKTEFEKAAQVRASHIQFKDKASAEKVLAQLVGTAGAVDKADDMQLFRRLAEQNNQDPQTKDVAGDLRFFSATHDEGESPTPTRPDAVRKAAFKLEKVGDVFPQVVQSEAGFHVVKLTGKRDAMTRTLEDARRLIQNRLWRQKREDAIEKFVAELRGKAHIQESAELLAKVKVKPPEAVLPQPEVEEGAE